MLTMSKKVCLVCALLTLLLGVVVPVALAEDPVSEPEFREIDCAAQVNEENSSCVAIAELPRALEWASARAANMSAVVQIHGEFFSMRRNHVARTTSQDGWKESAGEFYPTAVRIPLQEEVSLEEMGVFWVPGVGLHYLPPGWMMGPEAYYDVPRSEGESMLSLLRIESVGNVGVHRWTFGDQLGAVQGFTSYAHVADDMVMLWRWFPEVQGTELVLHVVWVEVVILTSREAPTDEEFGFWLPDESGYTSAYEGWYQGERVVVEAIYYSYHPLEAEHTDFEGYRMVLEGLKVSRPSGRFAVLTDASLSEVTVADLRIGDSLVVLCEEVDGEGSSPPCVEGLRIRFVQNAR